MARTFTGTSGWMYRGWRKHLYADMPMRRWLEVASRTFGALEIKGSFYTQLKPETYARWRTETPDDFQFALKGHRNVTHFKRLGDVEKSIVLLRDQARGLGDKLKAVVWQLPSTFKLNLERLDGFLVGLHGHTRKYSSSYSVASLKKWLVDIETWLADGREVHVYFDNDEAGHAVRNALSLKSLVSRAPQVRLRNESLLPEPYRQASWPGRR